jgi:hypothetical protein
MPELVVMGAALKCTFGAAPSSLAVLPLATVQGCDVPAANIQDFKPMVNIAPFGVCRSMSNPQVAAATAAAQGVLTPQPCVPATSAPWTPGASKTMVGGQPALTNSCTCQCGWGGTISITSAGQTKIQAT